MCTDVKKHKHDKINTQTVANPNLGSVFAVVDYCNPVEVVFVAVPTIQE